MNYNKAPKRTIKSLNFPTRIKNEERVIAGVDGVVVTSNKIKETISKYKARTKKTFWFPPGIDTKEFKPRKISQCKAAIKFLRNASKVEKKQLNKMLKKKILFLEVSRTTRSKQKDLILKAFSRIKNKNDALLAITVDKKAKNYPEIVEAYSKMKNKENIIFVEGTLSREEITQIFSLARVYITASLQEGWGMSVQQAAASKCAIISSRHVPFVTEVLKENALIVKKSQPSLYAKKIDTLLQKPRLREKLAAKSHKQIANNYSWTELSKKMVHKMKKLKIVD